MEPPKKRTKFQCANASMDTDEENESQCSEEEENTVEEITRKVDELSQKVQDLLDSFHALNGENSAGSQDSLSTSQQLRRSPRFLNSVATGLSTPFRTPRTLSQSNPTTGTSLPNRTPVISARLPRLGLQFLEGEPTWPQKSCSPQSPSSSL